jgi:predicted transcriptional regulator
MASKRKLKSLTIEKKSEILKEVDSGVKKKAIAEKYEIPPSTLSTIIKNRTPTVQFAQEICNSANMKRNRPRKKVNLAVLKWFSSVRNQNLPISAPILKKKVLQFAESLGEETFKASTGWLDKFKKR